VMGQCYKIVVGYTIPIVKASLLRNDRKMFPIPMATTEGALVASTSWAYKPLNSSRGLTAVAPANGMTQGTVL
ncbi:hypothetical protein BY996DRAFT_4554816, partial [Phakopsora pachyrhizi]